MKGSVVVMLMNLIRSSSKVLVAVTFCEGLVVPTATLPKSRLVGLTFRPPSSAKAGFAAARPIAKRKAKLNTKKAKRDDFDRDMMNPPEKTEALRVSLKLNPCVA
jgi:hypothetical protein